MKCFFAVVLAVMFVTGCKPGAEVSSPDGNLTIRLNPDGENLLFTRCLAGPADYHLGSFTSVPYDEFKADFMKPTVTSTRCHMLAMYVVLESTLQLVSDAPANYKDQPGLEFISEVPVVWDETRVPQAVMDEYVVTARRKGSDWYVGAISNSSERDVTLTLDFLGDG